MFFQLACHPALQEIARKKLRKHPWDKTTLEDLIKERYLKTTELLQYKPTAAPQLILTLRQDKILMEDGSEVRAKYYHGRFQALFNVDKFSGSVLVHEIGHYLFDVLFDSKQRVPNSIQEVVCQFIDSKLD